jgi:hypothetical protein
VREPYPYTRQSSYEYRFVSYGKKKIEKVATFIPAPEINAFSFAFGDLKSNGTTDTYVNSNNGDMFRVLDTIICIIKQFLEEYPDTALFFTGSTYNRDLLYHRIIRINYSTIINEFKITTLIQIRNRLCEVPFDPSSEVDYRGFYIRKIT